uniref:hypothetical protein n=1 Tax=uncultured Holdemania sp. TaxID=527664 RepID=UPI0025CC15E3
MNKKMIAYGLGLLGMIVIVAGASDWARRNENGEIKPTQTPAWDRTPEVSESRPSEKPAAEGLIVIRYYLALRGAENGVTAMVTP